MKRDWMDYASAAGSIATALTLVYLVIKEWKTRKHITDLGIIAKEWPEQNKLQRNMMNPESTPDFMIEGIHRDEYFTALRIFLKRENTVTIEEMEYDPGGFPIQSMFASRAGCTRK